MNCEKNYTKSYSLHEKSHYNIFDIFFSVGIMLRILLLEYVKWQSS